MSTISGYSIASGFNPEELQITVNGMINDGWQPLGSPQIASHPEKDPLFIQAMTKSETKAGGF